MSLVVVGSVAYDSIETPLGARTDMLGGSGTFFSIAASAFTKTSLVAVVGEDFAKDDLALLESHGVDLAGLVTAPGRTFRWGGRYHDDMNSRDTLFTELNVFESFEPVLSPAQRESGFVFLGNIQPKLQDHVLEQVRSPRFVAADTMNLWINEFSDALARTLRAVHLLIINDEEARLLAREHNLAIAAHKIRAMGPKSVVIKRGDAGAYFFHEDGCFAVPAVPLEEVKDPTGAGDSFAGGFMGYLSYAGSLQPSAIRNAMIAGSVMASFCVEQFSLAGLTNLTTEMIQDRFDAFYQLSQYERIQL